MEKNFIPVSQNLLTDPKIQALAEEYGTAEAVGHWVLTLLSLYGNGGRPLHTLGLMGQSQARLHGFTEEELDHYHQLLSEVGLISSILYAENRQVHNPSVQDHLLDCQRIREAQASGGRKSKRTKKTSDQESEQ